MESGVIALHFTTSPALCVFLQEGAACFDRFAFPIHMFVVGMFVLFCPL